MIRPSRASLLLALPLLGFACPAAPASACTRGGPARQSDERADQVEALITSGRRALAEGRTDEAQGLFVQAHVLSGESPATHVWVLRGWIAQGRINDALDELDRWLNEGRSGPDLDYVLGMAFYARAKDHLSSGVPAPTVKRNFEPCATYLARALEIEDERFPDAWRPLAEAHWYLQDGLRAQAAAAKAVAHAPADPSTNFLQAQILFTLFLEAERGGATERANGLWEEARGAYGRTLSLLEQPERPAAWSLRARAGLALAHVHLWRGERKEALALLPRAVSDDPTTVDYDGLQALVREEKLEAQELADLLDDAEARFVAREGAESTRDAGLLWWIGFLAHERGRETGDPETLRKAEKHLLASVVEEPAFLNAWYYAGHAAYLRRDYGAMVDAFRSIWEVEPANLIGMLGYEPEYSQRVLDWVLGWCAGEERALDAVLLCEIRVEFDAGDWERWNDLGLFARDAGRVVEDPEEAQRFWERALAAYERAYRIAPDKPHLLNDRAVVLQYDLQRDLDQARKLYETARDQARELLAGELSEADRALAQKALDDALANLTALD